MTMSADTRLDGHTRIVVLQSLRPHTRNDNPYLKQLIRAIEPHAEVAFFSWGRAIFGRYDVFHVHWPEFLLREQGRKRFVQYALFLAFMLRLKLSRKAVVRTLHNLEPHEGAGAVERRLLRMLDRCTRIWIRINETTPPRPPQTVTILHGHYRDWFADFEVPPSVPGRLLYFGLIRPYKGLEGLIEGFRAVGPWRSAGMTLRIVGNPSTAELRARIEGACSTDERISALLEYVDDETLAREIGQAELVVLPFRHMHNSGSLVLALSLDRPVLVPRNDVNAALAEEVGPGWIHMYDGDPDETALLSALKQASSDQRGRSPDLGRREWVEAGASHARVYIAALRGYVVGEE
jgi:beta-1,4-mannosyltransferase